MCSVGRASPRAVPGARLSKPQPATLASNASMTPNVPLDLEAAAGHRPALHARALSTLNPQNPSNLPLDAAKWPCFHRHVPAELVPTWIPSPFNRNISPEETYAVPNAPQTPTPPPSPPCANSSVNKAPPPSPTGRSPRPKAPKTSRASPCSTKKSANARAPRHSAAEPPPSPRPR